MKNYRNSIFVLLCIFSIFLSCGIAESFGDCCLDRSGKCYTNDAAPDSLCYLKDDASGEFVKSGKKLSDFIKNDSGKKTEVSQQNNSPAVNIPVETKEVSVAKPSEESKGTQNTVVNDAPANAPEKDTEQTQKQPEFEAASNGNDQKEPVSDAESSAAETVIESVPANESVAGISKTVGSSAVPTMKEVTAEGISETEETDTEPAAKDEAVEEIPETEETDTEPTAEDEAEEETPETNEAVAEPTAEEETTEETLEPTDVPTETDAAEETNEMLLTDAEPKQDGVTESGNGAKTIAILAPEPEINLPSEAILTWKNPDFVDDNTTVSYTINYEINGQAGAASVDCSSETCSYDLSAELDGLTEATVVWFVSSSDGVSSENSSFVLQSLSGTSAPLAAVVSQPLLAAAPITAPVQECPKGEYKTEQLGFYWAPVTNADSYTVNWTGKSGKTGTLTLQHADPTCQGGRCIVFGTLPGPDDYTWTVTAVNNSGSETSGSMSFTILRKIKTPEAYRPAYEITNRKFTLFEWEDVKDVDEFRIQVVDYWTGCIRLDRWYEPDCQNGVCYVQPDCFLPSGDYSWRVLGRNKNYTSHWSNWCDFSVQCDYCNVASGVTYSNPVPYASYPVGTITVLNPNYQWAAITGAYSYSFQLYDSSGKLLLDETPDKSLCTTELCTFDPQFTLPGNDVYTWKIAAYGYNGVNWGSSTGAFTVETDAVEEMAFEFLYPLENGYLDETNPLIIWSDPGNVAIYGLEIKGSDGTSLFTTALTPETAWCDGQTCSIQFDSIPDGADYQIILTPYTDYNNPGTPLTLTFNKGAKPVDLISPKDGAVVSTRPLFRWDVEYETVLSDEDPAVSVEKSLSYSLYLTDATGAQNVVSPLICGENGVNCENNEAFFSPAFDLMPGIWNAILTKADEPLVGEGISFEVK